LKVPILDLTQQYQTLKNEIHQAMEQVMSSSHFILGGNVTKLEQDIAAYSGVKHGIGVANGSDALHLSLMACDIKEGTGHHDGFHLLCDCGIYCQDGRYSRLCRYRSRDL